MAKLLRMPDLPSEYIRYIDDNMNHMVFDNRIFIKKLFANDENIDTLLELADLELNGFNTPKKVFIDDSEQFIYIASPYLSKYTNTVETIKNMDKVQILKLYRNLFRYLKNAHENELNPYDIKFDNYLISNENKPIFIDFDTCVYKGNSSWKYLTKPFYYDLESYIKSDNFDSKEALNANDKLLALQMFLQSISDDNIWMNGYNSNAALNALISIIYKYNILEDVEKYLKSIVIDKQLPSEDDYFIDTVINPLLDNNIELKKQL